MLTLPIKRKWFDMIVSGRKKTEYRDISDYWIKRLASEREKQGITDRFDKGMKICIKAGYAKDAPLAMLTLRRVDLGKGLPEWGAEPESDYIRLHIEKVELLTKGAGANDTGRKGDILGILDGS